MAGQLTIDTLKASSGVLATQNGMTGIAKAWVSWIGSTGSIRGSFNVSSVSRTGTGTYTINFSTALVNANYSVAISVQATSTGGTLAQSNMCIQNTGPYSSTQLGVVSGTAYSQSTVDQPVSNVAVFGA